MDEATIKTLAAINRRFYDENAATFIDRRQRPWRGWRRLLERLPKGARVLDVGCGHGRFLAFLDDAAPDPTRGYVGVDACRRLLDEAHARWPGAESLRLAVGLKGASPAPPSGATEGAATVCERTPRSMRTFVEGDVLEADLAELGLFDLVVAFGLLHHVPGAETRRALVRRLSARVAPAGHLVLALWRVDPTGEKHRAPPPDLDVGARDLLLGWGPNPDATRYCHDVDDDEATALAQATGLELVDDYRADGAGDRNRYLVMRDEPPSS